MDAPTQTASPPASPRRSTEWLAASLAYLLLACLLTWPLPLHLRTHLLGDTAGDLGVYVWNLWIFSHELIDHRHLPVTTDHLFAYTDIVDFSLHNYTLILGLFAVPLIPALGVVGAFNVLVLASIVLSALAALGLCRRLGLSGGSAWCAGAVFVASPVLMARHTAHASLVLAGPLPLFLWSLLRTLDTRRRRDAVAVGASVALATYADAYFGVYCVLMGLAVLTSRYVGVDRRPATPRARAITRSATAIAALAALAVFVRALGLTEIRLGPSVVTMQTLYTPLLVLVLALALRGGMHVRLHLSAILSEIGPLMRVGLLSMATAILLLSPVLIGIVVRYATGRLPATPIYWRSSPRGVDLLSWFVPNPNQEALPTWIRHAFMPAQSDAYPEFVASISIVGLLLILWAARGGVLPRFWMWFTAFFAALSLGPFVHVGGVNTQMIGPWALLRYVPVLGMARSPSRFAVVASLGVAILIGFALDNARRGRLRPLVAGVIALVMAIELLPIPRTLHRADFQEAYRFVAASPREGRVLELPTGLRDGTSSIGDFSASTMFNQTLHGRPILGGYLSRVSNRRRDQNRRQPMLNALHSLSATGGSISDADADAARRGANAFLSRACLAFVVVDRRRASPALKGFAVEALRLSPVYADESHDVFVPLDPPPCRAKGRPERTDVVVRD